MNTLLTTLPTPMLAQTAWDWEFAGLILPVLLQGLWLTVQATLLAIPIALVLGLVLALLRRSPRKLVRWPVATVIEFIRGTPLLIQLFFLFYALPEFGIRFGAITTGVIGLGLHFATYASEAYRAGIDAVPKGQWEAACSVNLSTFDTWRQIVLPQAIPTVIPALGNYAVAMFKDAVLLSAIAIPELVFEARVLQSRSFRTLEPFTLAGLLFLAISIPAAVGVRYLERRHAYARD